MNYKLTTFANYSGNSKTAETSKTLKYGDLEIKLINDEYYFVHDNGATIDNISLIKMIGSNFKGLISTFPQSITSDLINYAPSMTLFMNSLSDFVKKTELQDGTFDLIVSSVTADGFVSCISLSTTTSASIGSALSCNSLTVSTDANIYGLLNGCNIATTSLSSLGTLPIIPVIKSDSIMEVGRYLDFHYNNSDDYTVRLQGTSGGTLQVTNSKSVIDAIDLFSNNSNRVEFHVGQSNTTDKCAVLQYNVNPVSLGFGFFNHNDIMNLDPNGNLSINGTITSPTITTINNAIDGKAPLSHTHSISEVSNLQTSLDSKASLNHNHDSTYSAINHTHSSNDITDLDNAIDTRFRLILADLIYPVGIIVCFYQSLETLGATVWRRNPLVYLWNYMLWEFLPDDVFIRNGFKNGDDEEDGASMTPAGSNTHTHTTQAHTLTVDEMPSHNHQVRGSYNNQLTGNGENCIGLSLWGNYATYENTNNNGYGYIGLTGGGQSHSHGNTGSASNVPTHIVAYFYRRI